MHVLACRTRAQEYVLARRSNPPPPRRPRPFTPSLPRNAADVSLRVISDQINAEAYRLYPRTSLHHEEDHPRRP